MGIVNEAELEPTGGDDVPWERTRLAEAAGGEALGCSRYQLPPGERSWPYHYHTGNEEAIYVLAGEGTIRLDGDLEPLAAGDYVALPADERGAHRVINDGDAPLRFLVFSTMAEPDVTVYPDSGKLGVYAGSPPGGDGERAVEGYWRLDDDVDYWDGEE